jgi:DNA polymerase-1
MTVEHPKKLFLLDAMALIFRAYYAFTNNHRYNSKGLCTSAIFGFTNTLLEILNKEKPTHLAVVTDTSAPTTRHVEFADYKAHREEMPNDILLSLPYIQEIIKGFNIPLIGIDGYEADDIIGTLAKKAEQEGFIVYMMTPDKDFGQLVSENIFIYKPARMGNSAEILGPKEICERYKIKNPLQVIDILGLMGDKVDNIPGIPGIGEKTAIQLIHEYGSIEELLLQTDTLKGKLKEKIEQHKELALLSKKLATIITDAPINLNSNDFLIKEPNKEILQQVFNELEFRGLAKRVLEDTSVQPDALPVNTDLFGNPLNSSNQKKQELSAENKDVWNPANVFKTIKEVPHQYHLIISDQQIDDLINRLNSSTEFCFDTETTHTEVMLAELVGLSFAVKPHEAYYLPISEDRTQALQVLEKFKPVFNNPSILKIGQNIKYDLTVLKNYDLSIVPPFFDTMLAHYVLQPDLRHNMDVMAQELLKYTPISIESLIGKKGKNQLTMRQVPLQLIKEYAAEDADITLQLKHALAPKLAETHTLELYEKVELPLIEVLADMERTGACINIQTLKELSAELEHDLKKIEKDIVELAGTTFNINSSKQLGDVLFEVLQIDSKAKKTKTGQYATNEEILSKLEHKHPIVSKILDYRECQKLKSTYVDALPELINPKTGRIHTSYNQAVAATGRLSSNNPNLQNIPIRTPRGKEIRKAFIPPSPDYCLLSADYSQIELRIIADLSNETAMIEAFKNGEDIHASTAARVWDVPLNEVTPEMRRRAKVVNFGIIYGISAFGLSERIGISRTEAKEIIDQYFKKYPAIKQYMEQTIAFAREHGYVETLLKRRRYIKDINANNAVNRGFAERNAINAPIQGSAADMIKLAMISIHRELKEKNMRSKMIMQVHDELVFNCYNSERNELANLVKHSMITALPLRVPVEVEIGFGNNWLEAH